MAALNSAPRYLDASFSEKGVNMKSIAASIVVLAGAYLVATGAQWIDSPRLLVAVLGVALVGIGLWWLFVDITKNKND